MSHRVETKQHSWEAFWNPCLWWVFFGLNALNFWHMQNGRSLFLLERRSSSLVGSYSNPEWEKGLCWERGQPMIAGTGVTSRYFALPTPPLIFPAFRAMPLAIASVGQSVCFQVPGTMTSKGCGLSPARHLRTVQRRVEWFELTYAIRYRDYQQHVWTRLIKAGHNLAIAHRVMGTWGLVGIRIAIINTSCFSSTGQSNNAIHRRLAEAIRFY